MLPRLMVLVQGVNLPEADLGNEDSVEAKNEQVKYTFRKFIRLLSIQFSPLVFVLDDLQWADVQSLELLELLMTDRENTQTMIIGCYRSDEVNEEHMVSMTVSRLHKKCEKDKFGIKEIYIGNLALKETNEIVSNLLSIDDEETTIELARICHKRTGGNPYFLISFMAMLHEEKFLSYNFGLMKWMWKVEEIEEGTAAAENVVEILQNKMKKTTEELSQFLQLSSCLGSAFDEAIIDLAWRKRNPSKSDSTADLLKQSLKDNFLEQCGPSRYRWMHDNVQQAAMSLINTNELASTKYALGMILLRELSREDFEGVLFVAANLVNAGLELAAADERIEISKLNLRAAQKAKNGAAFASAAKYAATGISLLPADSWDSHYTLSLDLHSIGAEAEGIRGNKEKMQIYSDLVLNQEKASVFDKLPVYHIVMDYAANDGRIDDAMDLCLNVLEQLNCSFRRTSLGRLGSFVNTLLQLEKGLPTPEAVTNLKEMTDPEKIACMNLLKRLSAFCFMSENSVLMVLVIARQLRWTMRYGFCAHSVSAFIGYGMIMNSVNGKFDAGVQCAEYALGLLERLNTKVTESVTLHGANFLLLPWKQAVRNCISPSQRGYELGMQAGDTESACYCLNTASINMILSGKSLQQIDADFRVFVPQMEELSKFELADVARTLWQYVLNLMGRSRNPTVLDGEVADVTEIMGRNSKLHSHSIGCMKSLLYAYLGEYQLGADLAIEKGDSYLKALPGASIGMWETFSRGVALYATAQRTKQRKYKKHANLVRNRIKSWVGFGNPNVVHHLFILNAEQAVLDGDVKKAKGLFSEGIVIAARGGYIHDAGLASERYASLAKSMGDDEETSYRLEEASRFYQDWGASACVDRLREKYEMTPSLPNMIEPGSGSISLLPGSQHLKSQHL